MLSEKIINHMETDDLKKLLINYGELNNRQKELIMIKDKIIKDLEDLYKDTRYFYTEQKYYRHREKIIEELEDEMRKKYKAYLPKPWWEEDDVRVCQELEKMTDEELEENKKEEEE